MRKKVFITALGTVLLGGSLLGAAYASNKITIKVNHSVVATDVAPRMVDNRVLVPISFISRALGANVGWDQKTQTVTINSNAAPQQIDVWAEELDLSSQRWARIRNNISVFIAGYDEQEDKFIDLVVTEEFKKNKHNYIPIGGILPSILDYDITDVKSDGDNYIARVKVVVNDFELRDEDWDIYLNHEAKITATNKVGLKLRDSHTVFPGLTFKKQQH
ncbi:hypothetical protein PA598K_02605 [Paenibacillus sp. 598K]|uniref:copper amine oxidase N-terminal domain-containing protein n=1 Tax=Paenibacillus sp. 598K TaxID=1117987 RepID=UPI000FFAB977|nr:copper amine oxidase N-terminal domain-containing protein [Paenibacillus sp. 598K]GBF74269.1 hypothetical protein PA598K_02605 [Paenibacillus sp. 598K]